MRPSAPTPVGRSSKSLTQRPLASCEGPLAIPQGTLPEDRFGAIVQAIPPIDPGVKSTMPQVRPATAPTLPLAPRLPDEPREGAPRDASGAERERLLVERAVAGDREAFGLLYERTVDDVYSYVRLRVRDTVLAEDLTQDVFLRALRALDTFEWRGSLLPWLIRIAHNRIANHWRSVGRSPHLAPLPEDDPAQPQPELADPAAASAIEPTLMPRDFDQHLARLTALQREVIALRFGAGLSLAETADLLGRSTNAIKNLQHNALASLRRRLGAVLASSVPTADDTGRP